ncbi:MAG: EutN/CcmL family microcompartment protein [Planctomycetota bacterium]|nr:EutN/CcmL family microcompartment protein [Planctomycetota bacterium]MDA1249075.1 EutN/CcmL family microcompartment protein [Planctomycetota bacterium]
MQIAEVIGRVVSTIKHPSMDGWRLLIAQPLGIRGQDDGDPIIVIDELGSGRGDKVIITSDGKHVQVMVKVENSPVRFATLGIVDK